MKSYRKPEPMSIFEWLEAIPVMIAYTAVAVMFYSACLYVFIKVTSWILL